MQIGEFVEAAIQAAGISKVKVTDTLKYNRTTFNNKIRDNAFTIPEYIELCKFLNISYVQYFNQLENPEGGENSIQVDAPKMKNSQAKGKEVEIISELVRQNGILIELLGKKIQFN